MPTCGLKWLVREKRPGVRMRYDGKPVVLGPPREDEPWIPSAIKGLGDAKNDADYGAAA